MSIAVTRRANDLATKKALIEKQLHISKSTDELFHYAEKKRRLTQAREYYASARIQGIIRGFLARLIFKEKLRIFRAVILIQKLLRGKLGRIKWMREYWKSKSVVRSATALADLVARSTIVRDDGEERGWKEMFDPVTFGFWYYHEHYGMNTWSCPLSLQKELVCRWDGFHKFGGVTCQQRCRQVFDNMLEYRGHMTKAHRWYCPACEAKNVGLVFPKCSLCGNVLSEDGEDALEMMKKHAEDIDRHLNRFLAKDEAYKNPEYKIRDRMIQMSLILREDREEEKREKERLELEASKVIKRAKTFESKVSGIFSTSDNLPDVGSPQFKERKKKKTVMDKYKGKNRARLMRKSSSVSIERKVEIGTIPVPLPMQRRIHEMPPVTEKEDPVLFGAIPPMDFDIIVEDSSHMVEEEAEAADDLSLSDFSLSSSQIFLAPEIKDMLQVCKPYLNHTCALTTCPHAHPHIRDKAKVTYARIPGLTRRVPFVSVCEEWIVGSCPRGETCEKYHVYVRPSTKDIIQRMYPIQEGTRAQIFKSGAVLEGNVKGNQFHGYGVMHWKSKATYMGDWKGGMRHGFGIYRSRDGREYVGLWREGRKDGWGVLTHPNGEEYVGQFKEGKMSGIGTLTSRSGDVYEGMFEKGKYEGFGTFRKKNGDVYMGYCRSGMADGLGVLSLFTGEKYKGYFSRNARHGKGVCAYPNGSRYAGLWYRGMHEGYGIYLAPPDENGTRERYAGEWAAGKKHGQGRYFFANGDFYDGDFRVNKAKGMGIYVHTVEGNIYKGEWDNDMRNGRGTYNFSNGSRYTGGWLNNDIHGKGKFDFACGSFYRGEFKKNIKHGRGVFVWPNGNTYKGTFVEGIMEGQGEMKYCTGHVYTGSWRDNKKNGFGVFRYFEGHVYEGHWVDDVREGKGKMTFYPGTYLQESYEGDWVAGQMHGEGTYIYREADGTVYEGSWVKNRRHGKGKITFKDKSFYRGDFVDEQMHGRGVHVSADGTQYEGEWYENKRHGDGILMATDGSIYQGTFWHNRRHGKGTTEYVSGNMYTGTWDEGHITGKGVVTLQCGEGSFGGPTQVRVKVFGF
mmetsp:Transcript_10907/g.16624  ORF Transcript_10907/g.16624 Transcript_10907/m.16624 type:complete len:1070 (-) Transcript_10907:229-3438(-)